MNAVLSADDVRVAIDEPAMRAGISVRELTRELLARIDRSEPDLNAFVSILAEEALADAARADLARAAGKPLPLDGMPIALKDNIDVVGARATCGSKFFAERIAGEDAEVVARLRRAGAVIVGKTSMHEFGYGVTCANPFFGQCRNAWDQDRISGGSSGGSAVAVAADLCIAALGSDTGGSVRVPAALNGVCGLRPTYGRVSKRGVFPVSWSFDAVGPIARNVDDLAAVLAVIEGFDSADPRSVKAPGTLEQPGGVSVEGLRIGWVETGSASALRPDVAGCVERAARVFEALGAEIVSLGVTGLDEALEIWRPLIAAEALAVHSTRLNEDPAGFGADVRARLENGREISGTRFAERMHEAHRWRRRVQAALANVDIALCAAVDTVAEPIGAEPHATSARHTQFAFPWSLAHLPALVLPCGLSDEGLPIGLQLVGGPWQEARLIDVGSAYQRVTDWHKMRPPATTGGKRLG